MYSQLAGTDRLSFNQIARSLLDQRDKKLVAHYNYEQGLLTVSTGNQLKFQRQKSLRNVRTVGSVPY